MGGYLAAMLSALSSTDGQPTDTQNDEPHWRRDERCTGIRLQGQHHQHRCEEHQHHNCHDHAARHFENRLFV